MVSEWRSMIAVSLNVGVGVRFIKPAKLYMCTQKHYKLNEDGRTALGVCDNRFVPLSHSGNVVTRIGIHTHTLNSVSGEPGLVDRVLALHAGSRGFDPHRRHMSERFFRSNRPGHPHQVSSELENSGIRVAVGDCSDTERWW